MQCPELCNGVDDDCAGGPGPDEVDTDGDGVMVCEGDCDDGNDAVYPGAPEICDGLDDDCDGTLPADEQDADGDGAVPCGGDCDDTDAALNPADADGDGISSCDGDCDDADAAVYPGATEICNGVDDDCDGLLPADEQDADGDGFAPCEGDCDDSDAALNPADADGDGASTCDGDCDDGDADLNLVDSDADGDSTCEGDCDDTDPMIHPGAFDDCDGVDDDCDGTVDNPPDGDGDGAGLCDPYPDCDDGDASLHPVWVEPGAVGGLGTEAQPYGSIQDAVDSDHCGTVLLRAGTYQEGAAVAIAGSGVDLISVDGPGAAVVDGGYSYPLIEIQSAPVLIDGVDLVDGYGATQSGAVTTNGELTLRECRVQGNYSEPNSAAIGVYGASLSITDCQFIDNSGPDFGAIHTDETSVYIEGSEFWSNSGPTSAALFASRGEIILDGCDFQLNQALSSIVVVEDATLVGIYDSSFTNNEIDGLGIVYLVEVDAMELERLEFSDSMDVGSEVVALFSNGHIRDCSFVGSPNTAIGLGIGNYDLESIDAIGCGSTDTAAIVALTSVTGSVSRCRLHGNTVEHNSPGPGVLSVSSSSSVVITNVSIDDSSSTALRVSDGAEVSLINSTFFDTRPEPGEGAVHVEDDPSMVDIRNTIIAETDGYALSCAGTLGGWDYSNAHSTLVGTHLDPACAASGTGNLSVDPEFIGATADSDPSNDDLNLMDLYPIVSPCVDAGDPDPAFDDLDGSRNDMGAYGGPDPLP